MSISASSKESNITTETSFIIAWNIASSKQPYTDGEFVTQNLLDMISVLDPKIAKFKAFSLASDESTDIQDKLQMVVFVRYVTSDVLVKEELLDLVELKDTTRGIDLKEAIDTVLVKVSAPKNKLVSVAADGATAMVGKHVWLIGLLKNDPTYPEFVPVHCKDLTLKTFNHFSQIKKMIHNSNPTIQYDGHKIESYREKLKNLIEDFQNMFKYLYALKLSLAFLVNPFLIDIISDGCPISGNILEETSQFEMELLDLQEDRNLQMLHKTNFIGFLENSF
ncbi:uncharacterized protein LOC136085307 [Hydra vulgaris]|uniref:Uncharacterized protein LOC136085307 n=1 Tax=Hydra vulgaris TaxID=6087 RepID=A0ABM4CLL4_HYDVU